jgi:hypothetical protein
MPVKLRTAKARRQQFSPEVLALFQELERVPEHWRWPSDEWVADSKRLASLLGLNWFGMQHVNDASKTCCHEPGSPSHDDWRAAQEVRKQLLDAVREAKPKLPPIQHTWKRITDSDDSANSGSSTYKCVIFCHDSQCDSSLNCNIFFLPVAAQDSRAQI